MTLYHNGHMDIFLRQCLIVCASQHESTYLPVANSHCKENTAYYLFSEPNNFSFQSPFQGALLCSPSNKYQNFSSIWHKIYDGGVFSKMTTIKIFTPKHQFICNYFNTINDCRLYHMYHSEDNFLILTIMQPTIQNLSQTKIYEIKCEEGNLKKTTTKSMLNQR